MFLQDANNGKHKYGSKLRDYENIPFLKKICVQDKKKL